VKKRHAGEAVLPAFFVLCQLQKGGEFQNMQKLFQNLQKLRARGGLGFYI